MKKITKIEGNKVASIIKPKLRVAAYCRVSTGSDEQLVSLQAQKSHYEAYIKANPEWEYVGLYYDEGISGTGKVWQECILFFGMRGLTFLVNLAGLIVMVQYWSLDEFWSQLVLNGVIIILNYVLSKYVVFNLKSIKEYVERAVS